MQGLNEMLAEDFLGLRGLASCAKDVRKRTFQRTSMLDMSDKPTSQWEIELAKEKFCDFGAG